MIEPREPVEPERIPYQLSTAVAVAAIICCIVGGSLLLTATLQTNDAPWPAEARPLEVAQWVGPELPAPETESGPRLLGSDWKDHETGEDDSTPLPAAAMAASATRRSSCWPVARARYIAGQDPDGLPHDVCAVCLTREDLNVHHVIPFHVAPHLECVESNMQTLCRKHHFHVGHDPDLDGPVKANWSEWNPNVRRDAKRLREKLKPGNSP